MHLYRLKFKDKKTALLELTSKNVIDANDEFSFKEGIISVVEIGLIVENPAQYGEDGYEITQPTYLDGYHYDVKSIHPIVFGSVEIFPNTPIHQFA
ncbi:MAG: hypothetical protein ACOVOV_00780 [Dolichospermum sp.]